jgi:hypothetical protein
MKKKLVIALLLGISYIGNAQKLNNWQVGINLNPFVFSRINSENKPAKDKQDFPNGFGFGLTVEKNWNEHWGIKSGIEYSSQNQKYKDYYSGNFYEGTQNSDFKYFKIPLTLQFSLPLNEKTFLTFNQGFQVSILNDYKTTIEDPLNYGVIENGQYETTGLGIFSGMNSKAKDEYYKKTTFGIIGSIGYKFLLSKRFSYGVNLRYEYDLTSADNKSVYTYSYSGLNDNTKNFRIGLELGLQYHFSLAGCDYCDRQKH